MLKSEFLDFLNQKLSLINDKEKEDRIKIIKAKMEALRKKE